MLYADVSRVEFVAQTEAEASRGSGACGGTQTRSHPEEAGRGGAERRKRRFGEVLVLAQVHAPAPAQAQVHVLLWARSVIWAESGGGGGQGGLLVVIIVWAVVGGGRVGGGAELESGEEGGEGGFLVCFLCVLVCFLCVFLYFRYFTFRSCGNCTLLVYRSFCGCSLNDTCNN